METTCKFRTCFFYSCIGFWTVSLACVQQSLFFHSHSTAHTYLLYPYNFYSLGLLWQLTKSDIEETLKHVCKKVLFDHSVSDTTRQRRAVALFMLGEEYVMHQVKDMNGIQDFLERLGKQTGLFSEDNPDFSPFTGGTKDGAAGQTADGSAGGKNGFNAPGEAFFSDALSKDMLLQMQARVDIASVKELKECIAALGGDASHCIEKEDLRKYLKDLLAIRLSVAEAV